MIATLDLPAVRQFTEDLNIRLRGCGNDEGMFCSNLDATIHCYVKLCEELRSWLGQWTDAVFAGEVAFDAEVDNLFKTEAQHLLDRTKEVAAYARAIEGQCYELTGLNALHYHVVDFGYLLQNWFSPQLAVGPAPRVKVPKAVEQQALERLKSLPPLPSNWQPTDAEQRARFQKQRAK